jgi:hypothetical protein
MQCNPISSWPLRLTRFKDDADSILGVVESSKSRIVTLDMSYSSLLHLNVKQDDLFRQALRCVEVGVFRAAHVMAWAGLVDCLHGLLASDAFCQINAARPNWNIVTIDQLREAEGEHNQIEAMYAASIITKTERKAYQGLLSKRNECAHPADYYPTFNEALGFISEVFQRIEALNTKFPGMILKSANS